jgi:PKD repeat protein
VLPDYTNPQTDPKQDSLYGDINNGNEILDFDAVVTYYDNLDWIGESGLDRRI